MRKMLPHFHMMACYVMSKKTQFVSLMRKVLKNFTVAHTNKASKRLRLAIEHDQIHGGLGPDQGEAAGGAWVIAGGEFMVEYRAL